jgi:aminoglycoside/choline kinase family phosphotransferase
LSAPIERLKESCATRLFEMKTDLLLRQTRLRLPAFSAGRIEISAIEKGGSDRRFYRVRCSTEQSLILVKYNLEREENRHYVRIAEFLGHRGIRSPKVYFHDPEEGLIWIEDLGEADLFSFSDDEWLTRRALYHSALDEIAKLHQLPETEWSDLRGHMPPEFTAALYQWEQNYFFENCLGRIFQFDNSTLSELSSLPALRNIAEELASLPRVLVHRDFQSQNIIVRNGQAYLIDFQGMRPGLAEYDLASLLFDPYVRLTFPEREELFSYYLERRRLGANPQKLRERLRFCAMQRLMQALGAYGFLGLAKGNRQFLRHVPAALNSLRSVVAEEGELKALGAALAYLPLNVSVG